MAEWDLDFFKLVYKNGEYTLISEDGSISKEGTMTGTGDHDGFIVLNLIAKFAESKQSALDILGTNISKYDINNLKIKNVDWISAALETYGKNNKEKYKLITKFFNIN